MTFRKIVFIVELPTKRRRDVQWETGQSRCCVNGGVPPNYVGYAYLLDAADSFGRGGALPQLFETIAQRHGKRGFQVRKGMANVAKYLRTTAMGQAWRREQGRLLSHWDVIELLIEKSNM